MNWYYAIEGRSQGPLTEDSLKQLAREGAILPDTLVWHPGLEKWEPLAELRPDIAELGGEGTVAPPPDGKTGPMPLPNQAGREGAAHGIFKRLFGWGRKNPE